MIKNAVLAGIVAVACLIVASVCQAATRGLSVELRASETKDAPVSKKVKLYGSSYALVIGNDAYTGSWPRLSNAVKDARLVAAALRVKGFEVTLKTNLKSRELVDAFESFFYETGDDPDARLFVWYAGHGHSERSEGYLVPVDAPDPGEGGIFKRKAMSLRRMGEYVRGSDALHVLAVFDSCFAGTIFNVGRAKPPAAITHATTRPVRQFLTSGDAGQEVADDGTFRKLFIHAINGENRADANGDGYLAASELGLFMADKITNYSNGGQTPRNGKLNDPDLDLGDFVFQVNATINVHVTATSPLTSSSVDKETIFWQSIEGSQDVDSYQAYLDQYPTGSFAGLAKVRLKKLKSQKVVSLTAPNGSIEAINESYAVLKTANIRSEPSKTSKKIGVLPKDTAVTVTGKILGGKWLRVKQAGGKVGYVYGSLLAPFDPGEIIAWSKVQNTKSVDEISAFLHSYPAGLFAGKAKALKAALTPQVAAISPPKVTVPSSLTPAVGVYPNRISPIKVGFVYVSPVGNYGWTYQHDVGRKAMEKALGNKVKTTYVEKVSEGPDAQRVIGKLASSGYNLIFTTSFGYMNPTLHVAKKYKKVQFEHVGGYKRSKNVSTYSARHYEGRHVIGLIAGKMTKSNVIGYVASFPIPEVIRGINAVAIAARSVNPMARVKVVWVSSWFDPVKEAAAAKALIDQGADVLMQHTGSSAPIQVAERRGAWAFGQTSNMHSYGPKAHLTSIINNWGPYYTQRANAAIDGTWKSDDTWDGFKAGMVQLAPYNKAIPVDVVALAEKARKGIIAGTVHPFAGPIKNQIGKIVVKVGETAPDRMLAGMNFYVDGVDGAMPK